MNNQSSSNGFIIGIIVVVIIVIVGYLAFKQGYFNGKTEDASGIEIKLGSNSN